MLHITAAHQRQYREEGYFIVESVFSAADLAMLRTECESAVAMIETAMDQAGRAVIGLNHRGRRYIVPLQYKRSDHLPGFLFSATMAAMCRATLGPDAYLFLEQFVVKGAGDGMALGWHQDAGYLPFDPPPYVTGWIPLDDVDKNNGTIALLPYSRAGTRVRVPHDLETDSGDRIGYRGTDPGIAVVVPAGSLAVFSATVFHCSGPNRSAQPRRAYIVQYSAAPIVYPDGSGLRHFADPFLRAGRQVPQPSPRELKQAPAAPWTWE